MIDFAAALTEVRKELGAADVHIETAIGNGGSRKGRLGRLKRERSQTMTATVAKAAPTGKTVWAWASVIEEDGKPVIDHQGDMISEAELEKAFDGFMENSRDVGLMHNSVGHGRVTQGLVFTKELQQALGIDLGRVGSLVKIQVDDPEVQKRVASGELRELSIGGTGKRKKI